MTSLSVRIESRRAVSEVVEEFILRASDDTPLPEWAPGAHIDVHLPTGTTRQFSLTGDPRATATYRIAVLREEDGRGGSAWLHTHASPGTELAISPPRNNFPLQPAPAYLLIAGGVGITPLLPMARELTAMGAAWRMAYLGRSKKTMAFLDELASYGESVSVLPADENVRYDVSTLAELQDTAVYACGPDRLLAALEAAQTTLGAGSKMHLERFSPLDRGPVDAAEAAFEVQLETSGLTVRVSPDQTVLSAVEEAGITPPYSCREGTCGSCETRVIAGVVEHRDSILDADEQAANDVMMICVSRSKSEKLVLEL
jgi:ferredoxin-NADP reductase